MPQKFLNSLRVLRDALLYPLHLQSALLIVITSGLAWALCTTPFGWPLLVILVTALVHFLLRTLRTSALGETEPPLLTADDLAQPGTTPLKLLLVVITWTSLQTPLAHLFPVAATAFAMLGFFLLPAFATLLVLEDSLAFALSPQRLASFAWRGGMPYILLAGLLGLALHASYVDLAAATASPGFMQQLLTRASEPATLGRLVLVLYAATLVAHLLGRIAARAHDFAGPASHQRQEVDVAVQDDAARCAQGLATLLRAEKKNELLAGWEFLETRDAAFQAALLDALVRERAWGLVPRQADRAIKALLAAKRQRDAVLSALSVIKDFESFATDVGTWLRLCAIARDLDRDDWLEALSRHAERRFENYDELLDLALLRAQYLAGRRNDIKGATELLAPFLRQTQHARYAELQRLHDALAAISG